MNNPVQQSYPPEGTLGILSIFLTVDGECNYYGPGTWSVFIRTRGCTVGCHWCDTKYSWNFLGPAAGNLTVPQILTAISKVNDGKQPLKVTITGGEPLEQRQSVLAELIRRLVFHGSFVSVETAGTQNTVEFRNRFGLFYEDGLSFVVDYKLKSSKFKGRMDEENHFYHLEGQDIVKMVIDSEDDFHDAMGVALRLRENLKQWNMIYLSPSFGNVLPGQLFGWMKKARCHELDVRLNVQTHKFIFTEDMRDEEENGIDFTKRGLGREEFLKQIRESK